MRRVRYSVAMSLDGYIAGPSGEYDWIPDEPAIDFGAFLKTVDTLLMGRKTFETVLAQGPGGAMPGMRSYVFSRTLRQDAYPDVTIVQDDATAVVSALRKAEKGKDIWLFGGGGLFRSLLEARLVDTVEIGLVPVLLGAGIPLLPGVAAPARLTLRHHERFPSGILLLKYDVGLIAPTSS